MNATQPRTASWTTVAKREILAQISEKAFWIATVITIVVIGASFALVNWFSSSAGPARIAVSSDDAAAVVQLAVEQGENLEAVRVPADALIETVVSGDADAALDQVEGTWQVSVTDPRQRPELDEAVQDFQLNLNAQALGVDAAEVSRGIELDTLVVGGDDAGPAVLIASTGFSILFLIAATTYGTQIAQSVVTEKESRIVEILAAAIPLRQLLLGKVVGNTILALGQMVLLVAAALTALAFTEYSGMIPLLVPVAGWFIVFFLVGFASLACLWAAAGAMATRMQDIGQTTSPLMMAVLAVYFAGLMAQGTLAQVLSYLPIASTVLLPGRLLNGQAGWLDAVLALLAALAFMAVAVWLGAGVYRRGLLKTNSVMTFKEALLGR